MTSKDQVITPAYLWFDAEFTSLDVDEARLLQVENLPKAPPKPGQQEMEL